MNNIISSDFYRVRRGAAFRNTCLGLALVVIFMLIMFVFIQSDSFSEMIANTSELSIVETADIQQEMQSGFLQIENGVDFAVEILSESIVFLFFLPITIAVFCADFTAGTYRNTLSYESNRSKVYMAKLLMSIVLCFAMVIVMVIVCLILGSIAFGFSGFTVAAVGKLLITVLLQLPIYLATVTVCHCISSITKKSSMTIAIFLVGYFVLALILQLLTGVLSLPDWIMLIEPQSAGKFLAEYASAPSNEIAFVMVYYLVVTALAVILGVTHYRKTDMP